MQPDSQAATFDARRPTPALLVALVYLALPGHPLGWLGGLPLGPLGLATLVVAGLVIFAAARPRLGGATRSAAGRGTPWVGLFFGALCLLKVGTALAAPAYGLEARYFGKPDDRGRPEWSSEFPGLGATRLDRELSFAGDRFPLYFFNDNLRFNYYTDDKPDRLRLPFAVHWRGLLEVPEAGEYRLSLTAAGRARVELASTPSLRIENSGRSETVEQRVWLAAGAQPIEVDYARRAGQPAQLMVGWDRGGEPTALAAPFLLAEPSSLPPGLAAPLLWFSHALDVLFLGAVGLVLVGLLRQRAPTVERPLLALLLAGVFAYAALSSLDLHRRVVILDGGADWLTYETYARDILENGPLMTLGKALGKGRAYYFQPFYPYALAAGHWLAGEDLYGVVVLQLFGIGVAGVLVYFLGKRLFGAPSGVAGLAILLGVLGPLQFDWVARRLLSENIYFWLLPASALALIGLADRPARGRALLAGVLLGLCCVTRGPTLLWVPTALGVTYGMRGRGWVIALAALAFAAVVALVPLRNYVVAGQPSLVATNGIATIDLAHPLTPAVDLRGVEKNPLYRALRLDFGVIQLVEFVRQDPLGYAATLVPLGLYALGLPGMLEAESPVRWELVGLVGLYLAYLIGAVGQSRGAAASPALLLHTFIGLHFLVMMVFLPNVYGYRQVLPMYVFLAVFGGHVLAGLAERAGGRLRRSAELKGRHGRQGGGVDQYVPRAGAAAGHEELA